ncbi:MAG: excinuclease ABC subunit UvrC [bacterium]|nr:excinuclease ABC subunit UvrC [bacterium]
MNRTMRHNRTDIMTSQNTEERLRNQVDRLPLDPGVYLFKDSKGRIIYVGKAKELRTRVRSYFRDGGDGRYHIQFLIKRIAELDFMVTRTEQEALILENNLIKKHRPRYNIFLRDDKTYVNVRLNVDHAFPRLTIVRNPRKDKAKYFGPYASAGSVRSTLRTLGKIFPMRTCSDQELANRKRPCLYYYIKRCPAPCVGYVDAQVYADTVGQVTMFLKGRGDQLTKALKDKMELQAAERKYEKASRTRDQLYAVQRTLEKQRITKHGGVHRDIFGVHREKERMTIQVLTVRGGKMTGGDSYHFENATLPVEEHLSSFINQYYQRGAAIPNEIILASPIDDGEAIGAYLSERREARVRFIVPQRGEKKQLADLAARNARVAFEDTGAGGRSTELLEELQDLLELRAFPHRIECFDISNFQGSEAVASRVAFVDGEPARTLYRHYRVRTIKGANDYGMMEEVLKRRIAKGIKEHDLPDLLLVDGGRGQLNVALKVMDRLGAEDQDVLGIAKVKENNGKRKVRDKERIYSPHLPEPLLLEGNSDALHLLQRIRDEAHRFAITYHKKIRSKGVRASVLDAVPGVGPVLKQRLLTAFAGPDGMRKAGTAGLVTVQGVSSRLAAKIIDVLGRAT